MYGDSDEYELPHNEAPPVEEDYDEPEVLETVGEVEPDTTTETTEPVMQIDEPTSVQEAAETVQMVRLTNRLRQAIPVQLKNDGLHYQKMIFKKRFLDVPKSHLTSQVHSLVAAGRILITDL